MKKRSEAIRVSKEMIDLIRYIRARHLINGKRPPSVREITQAIARKTNKERLYLEEFMVRF